MPHSPGEAGKGPLVALPLPPDLATLGAESWLEPLGGLLPGRTDSAAPGPVTVPVAPTAPATQQIVAALSQASGPVTELRLSPEELGSVRIEVRTEGDKVTVIVAAERPETLELLRRSVDRLGDDLRDAGFAQLDLSFGRWPGPGDDGRGESSASVEPEEATTGAPPSPAGQAVSLAAAWPADRTLYLRI